MPDESGVDRPRKRTVSTLERDLSAALADADGRTKLARHYAAIRAAILSDCGGIENVTKVRASLIDRFAALTVWADAEDSRALAGRKIDLSRYAAVAGGLRRLADAIGLDRVSRQVEPLDAYLKRAAPREGDEE